jgi:hypothetical protein
VPHGVLRAVTARRPGTIARATAALVLATGVPECGAVVDDATRDEAAADGGARASAASWTLAWDRSGVTPAEGGGWDVETDRGYRVHLAAGAIVLHSVSLGVCPGDAGAAGGDGGLSSWLTRAIAVRAAAAHEDVDPSTLDIDVEEDLVDPVELGPLHARFAAGRYCRAHWLVARSDAAGGDPFARLSLRVRGTWTRGDRAGSFDLRTGWPEGQLVELAAAGAATATLGGSGSARAVVRVERRLATLFDGVDFAGASDAAILGRAIANVVGTARVTAAFEPDAAAP